MNNKNLMIGLGVLAVAGIGLYMWKRRKDGQKTEKKSDARGDFGSTFGSSFGSVSRENADVGTICRYSSGEVKGSIGQACQTTDDNGALCNGKLQRSTGSQCDCVCPKMVSSETSTQNTRMVMPRRRRF